MEFPKIVVPQNGWFIIKIPIKRDDLGGPPLFLETPIYGVDNNLGFLCLRRFFSFLPR